MKITEKVTGFYIKKLDRRSRRENTHGPFHGWIYRSWNHITGFRRVSSRLPLLKTNLRISDRNYIGPNVKPEYED